MAARKLHISEQLLLPLDVVTSTTIVYGGKGMGKTNFGSVLAEECAAAGLRFSVVDPMGVWWGLRHSADGKGPGIEVLILGGIHGDIPIEPTGGAVVADLVVDEDANVVIDISRRPDGTMWSIGERVRFVTDYSKRLYQRQGEKRRPILQIYDEFARFCPQVIRQGEEQVAACMGAIAVLVEEGRNVGIGVCGITQRSARLNKDVAELADCMIAFRTLGPNSRRAVMEWLGEHVEKERAKELGEGVRKLPRGSALVVSPGWLAYEGIAQIRMRQTFDSSATPKGGKAKRATGPGAKPDLAKYQQRMAATIEKAKAEDPKTLRARIQTLERELATKKATPAPAAAVKVQTRVEVKRVEVPIIKDAQVKRFEQAIAQAQRVLESGDKLAGRLTEYSGIIRSATQVVAAMAGELKGAIDGALKAARAQPIAPAPGLFAKVESTPGTDAVPPRLQTSAIKLAPAPRPQPAVDGAFVPAESQQRILNALRWLEQMGLGAGDKTQVALLADQSPTSSTYQNNLSALRTAGLIEYPGASLAGLTPAGRALAEPGEVPSTSAELLELVCRKLPASQAAIVRLAVGVYPAEISKTELAEKTGQSPTSSTYQNNLSALRSLRLIDYTPARGVVARPVLFIGG